MIKQYEDILAAVSRLPVIDTHEHLVTEAEFVAGWFDFADIMTYTGLALAHAGMPHGPWGEGQFRIWQGADPLEKWRRIAPYWPSVRNTRWARCSRRAFKKYFDVDDLTEQTAMQITERLPEYQHRGVYREQLRDAYGIRLFLRGECAHPEPEYFRTMCYLDPLVAPVTRMEMEQAMDGAVPPLFEAYWERIEARLETSLRSGIVALKITGWTARSRPLDFAEQTPADIARAYRFAMDNSAGRFEAGVMDQLKPFHDAAHWRAFAWAARHDVPVQVHTGLEFEQPGDGRPSALIPTLIRHRETRFALLHAAYPYLEEVTGLALAFPNATLDLAWLHLLSGTQATLWLDEWLDLLPLQKILAFGGDCLHFFEVGPNLEMAYENLAAVLAGRMARGRSDLDEAIQTARALLFENPMQYYGLPGNNNDKLSPDC